MAIAPILVIFLVFQRFFVVGRHRRGDQGMRPRNAMWLALRDFYANSWRLVVVNAVLGAALVLGSPRHARGAARDRLRRR